MAELRLPAEGTSVGSPCRYPPKPDKSRWALPKIQPIVNGQSSDSFMRLPWMVG